MDDASGTASILRFGVIGTGRITRRLVAELQSSPGVSVTAIASRTRERADWFASQYGIAAAVVGYDALLARDDVDAVYISLPPALHAHWAAKAAEAGKHVLCEKPLAVSVDEAELIAKWCDQHNVRWLDATGWLHHRRTAEMTSIARSGKLGKLGHISVSVSFYRPFQSGEHRLDPSLGGGCLLDLGWYAVGLACHMADQTPTKVYADTITESGVPLRANGILWFEDSLTASCLTASFSCGYDTATRKWFEVAGSDASIICDDFTRPWADRPTRFWVHDASGQVTSHEYTDRQEQRMIRTLVGTERLDAYQNAALRTQRVLSALAESASIGQAVAVPPSSPS